MKKRVVGIGFEASPEGTYVPTPIELEEYQCICLQDKPYTMDTPALSYPDMPTSYTKGELYPFCIDEKVANGHQVFIEDKGNHSNRFTKEEFDKYFQEITEYRDSKINNILDEK